MTSLFTTTTLTIDRIACDGYGLCAELLPERIELDDWGYPILSPEPIPDQLLDHAKRVVARCPVLAVRLRTERRGFDETPAVPTRRAKGSARRRR